LNSIVEDVAAMRLVLDNLQAEQAKKELKGAEDVLPRVARECYKWLLCPSQDNPTNRGAGRSRDVPPPVKFELRSFFCPLGEKMQRHSLAH
jgi:predicted AAA+ superfamily ATPase